MRGGAAVGGVRRWVDAVARDAPLKLPGPKVEAADSPLQLPGPKVEAADLPVKLPAPKSTPPTFR